MPAHVASFYRAGLSRDEPDETPVAAAPVVPPPAAALALGLAEALALGLALVLSLALALALALRARSGICHSQYNRSH